MSVAVGFYHIWKRRCDVMARPSRGAQQSKLGRTTATTGSAGCSVFGPIRTTGPRRWC